eukprot:318880-Prymnesium_polylepis.1
MLCCSGLVPFADRAVGSAAMSGAAQNLTSRVVGYCGLVLNCWTCAYGAPGGGGGGGAGGGGAGGVAGNFLANL